MRIISLISFLLMMVPAFLSAQLVPNLGGQRTGISVAQFLKIGAGPRGAGMGEAFVAVVDDASALYWNPAGAVRIGKTEVTFAHTIWLVDLQHEFAGGVFQMTPDDALGVSMVSLRTDDTEITTETEPSGTGRFYRYADLALGLSYSRRMTDQFSFGATIKYIDETLDVLSMRGVLFDLGTLYWTGLGSVRFGVVVSNFGTNMEPSGKVTLPNRSTVTQFQSFAPPTLFKIGIAFEPYESSLHKITTSLQLNHPNDNSEHVRLGIEYTWDQIFSLRGGVKRTIGEPLFGSDGTSEEDVAFGLGVVVPVQLTRIRFDYSFSNFNLLGSVHRFGVGVSLE